MKDKHVGMMLLQGGNAEQMAWLAAHVGRLYDKLEKLKVEVAGLKASRTKEKNKRKKERRKKHK